MKWFSLKLVFVLCLLCGCHNVGSRDDSRHKVHPVPKNEKDICDKFLNLAKEYDDLELLIENLGYESDKVDVRREFCCELYEKSNARTKSFKLLVWSNLSEFLDGEYGYLYKEFEAMFNE